MTCGMFDAAGTAQLRTAVASYTVDAVNELLGPVGRAALERGDVRAAGRQLLDEDRVATLIRLFLLAEPVPEADAARALEPLPLDLAARAGLVACSAGEARASVDVRPYSEAGTNAAPWWVVADFGSDVRRGPLAADHVLGIGAAGLTLAQATPRTPVASALDIGTGCGVQSLHLTTHAEYVVATDVNARALRLAATTAALSGQEWDLRQGSLLEPVAGERFDLVVSNPPFVISSGNGGYAYRDSGLSGDEVCRTLVRGIAGALSPNGTGQLLANWLVTSGQPWTERLENWLAGLGCDAWIWQREVVDPAEYVALWLRDAGEQPGTDRWSTRYDAWSDWFAANDAVAVGMGLITIWRTERSTPAIVLEDVPQAYERPIGGELVAWHARQNWLAATDDAALLAARLSAAAGLVLDRSDVLEGAGWTTAHARLRQPGGMRWAVDTDDAICALVAGCDGATPLATVLGILAAALEASTLELSAAALPVVRDLVARGFLVPGMPA